MIYCSKTGDRVYVSSNPHYVFFNPENETDLHRFDTVVKVSDLAMAEARAISKVRCIPDNYCNDTELQLFVTRYLKNGYYSITKFKELNLLRRDKLEYVEEVLLYILYMDKWG